MGKKKADGGLWSFAARFLISAAVTAGFVRLLSIPGEPAPLQKVTGPLQSLPTLPPKTGPVQGRVLKHSNGLCVKLSGRLVLAECGVLEGVAYIFHQDALVQLRIGEGCVTAQGVSRPCGTPETLFRRQVVGTDLFLMQQDTSCLAPETKPADGTRLALGSCTGDDQKFQTSEAAGVDPPSMESVVEVQDDVKEEAATDVLVHLSGLCVTAQDEATGEDSTVLVLADCEEDPAKNVRFAASGNVFRFQIGRQCGHPEQGPDASAEPRVAFPADCKTARQLTYQKLAEDIQLPGFVIQHVETKSCIHPLGGSSTPPMGTDLIHHKQCDFGRNALRFRSGNPSQLAKEEPKLKKMGNTQISVPSQEPCSYYDEGRPQSSRPGKPCLPPPPFWPYTGRSEWRAELGSRALAAVTPLPELKEERCNGWYLLGDQTWCNKAFDGSHGYGQIGLSFGIEERDIWSELVTQKFHLPVRLFDCFIPPERSPPISGTAPNNSAECPKNEQGEPLLKDICYAAGYQSFRVCLAGQEVVANGRTYATLEQQLRGWGKLSVHLKIDVEGSEWDVLEWLVSQPTEWDKVRTLDMEIHFGFGSAANLEKSKALSERAQLEREVKIMEALRERFYCTGSTLEVYRQGWAPEECAVDLCPEPPIYLPNSFSVTAFAVSYVHKELVD